MLPFSCEDPISFAASLALSLIATVAAIARVGGCFLPTEFRPLQFGICLLWILASIGLLGVIISKEARSTLPWTSQIPELIDLDDVHYQRAYNILLLANCSFPIFFEVCFG